MRPRGTRTQRLYGALALTLAGSVGVISGGALVLTGGAAVADPPADPPGNNGTVKIAEESDGGHPNTDPHVPCTFTVQWFNFGEGVDITSDVSFVLQDPTDKAGQTLTVGAGQLADVFVGEDPIGAAWDLDAQVVYTLSFTGEAHPQHGYHVKMTVETDLGSGSGSDAKYKVFWVGPCAAPTEEPSETTEEPTTPTEEPSETDTTEPTVEPSESETTETTETTEPTVEPSESETTETTEPTVAPTESTSESTGGPTKTQEPATTPTVAPTQAEVPTAVDAGIGGSAARQSGGYGLIALGSVLVVAGAVLGLSRQARHA